MSKQNAVGIRKLRRSVKLLEIRLEEAKKKGVGDREQYLIQAEIKQKLEEIKRIKHF